MESWGCYECGISEASSPGAVRKKIDAMHLKLRKASSVDCYEIKTDSRNFRAGTYEAKIIEYVAEKWSRSYRAADYGEKVFEAHEVASVAAREGTRPSRKVMRLQDLAPVSDEAHAALDEANRLGEIAKKASDAFHEAVKAIPRVPIEALSGLIEASGSRFEEGET